MKILYVAGADNLSVPCPHCGNSTPLHKIGITTDVDRRSKELRANVGSAVQVLKTWQRPDADKVEWAARQLARHLRAMGFEWFSCTAGEAIQFVEHAIQIVDSGDYERFRADTVKRRVQDHEKGRRGRVLGQPPKLTPAQITEAQELRDQGASCRHIAKMMNVSPGTIYNHTAGQPKADDDQK